MSLSRRQFTKEFKLAVIQRLEMGASVGEVARAFEVNPNVLHPWRREFRQGPGNAFPGLGKRRYDPDDLRGLEDSSHSPHRRRGPTWTPRLVERVLVLRQQYPRWGKDKLAVLLRREGCQISTSMVGRILTHRKKRGVWVEPLPRGLRVRRPRPAAWFAETQRPRRARQPYSH